MASSVRFASVRRSGPSARCSARMSRRSAWSARCAATASSSDVRSAAASRSSRSSLTSQMRRPASTARGRSSARGRHAASSGRRPAAPRGARARCLQRRRRRPAPRGSGPRRPATTRPGRSLEELQRVPDPDGLVTRPVAWAPSHTQHAVLRCASIGLGHIITARDARAARLSRATGTRPAVRPCEAVRDGAPSKRAARRRIGFGARRRRT